MFAYLTSALGPALAFGLPVYQARNQHFQSIDQSNIHHLDGIEIAEKHHHVQMEHDREISRRESVRDIYASKSSKSQTLMINSTLMFGGGFAILVEGIPPPNSPLYLLVIFAIFLGLSFLCLFLSVWFSMTLQSVMNKFNIHDSEQFYICRNGIQTHGTFAEYYGCHCVNLSKYAVRFFYAGTVSLMITAAVLFHLRFSRLFHANASIASYVFAGMIAITLAVIAILKKTMVTNPRISAEDREVYLNG